MKSFLLSLASIIVGILLWFILYIALVFICLMFVSGAPAIVNGIDWLVRVLHAEHWYPTLLTAIPAIVPAIIIKLILKSTSLKTQNWTIGILTGLLAIEILTIETLTFWGKAQGIIGEMIVFWSFGRPSD